MYGLGGGCIFISYYALLWRSVFFMSRNQGWASKVPHFRLTEVFLAKTHEYTPVKKVLADPNVLQHG